MATRVLVTVRSDADVDDVVTRLTGLGDAEVQPPQPELPGVCVATVDEQRTAADAWAAKAASVPGVAGAEVDRLRWSM
ncbi:MAG TPA: hypothetical protein VFU98_14115 [Microlunatus sp.]|nr:hypothetical protein [Microlunatus sp.]